MRPILCTCVVLAAAGAATALSAPTVDARGPTQVPVHPGSARLRGPTECAKGALVHVVATGRRIADVTFYFDNKRVKFLTVPNQPGGRWTLPIRVRALAFGTHWVKARFDFVPASRTSARTLRISFSHCHRSAVSRRLRG
jgi:hypothetical protein